MHFSVSCTPYCELKRFEKGNYQLISNKETIVDVSFIVCIKAIFINGLR